MKIKFNHVVSATVSIVFMVTTGNSKSVLQNPVVNNQSSPAKPRTSIASNSNVMMYIKDTPAAQVVIITSVDKPNKKEHQTAKKQISIKKLKLKKKGNNYMLGKVINPTRRNKKFINSTHYNMLCKKMGLTITSTGECKPKFIDEEDGLSVISN